MNEVVVFALIIHIIIRLLGVSVSLDFYSKKRDKKYIIFCLGWSFCVLGAFFPIIADLENDPFLSDLFYIFNPISVSIGMFLITIGVFSYFRDIRIKLIMLTSIFLALVPLSFFFLFGLDFARYISLISFYASITFLLLIQKLENSDFKSIAKGSIYWYYLTILSFFAFIPISFLVIPDYTYGLYQTDDLIPIFIFYGYGITTFLLMFALLIHLENSVNLNKKNLIKDTYSHDIGNILQAILSSIQIIDEFPDKDPFQILEIAQKKCIDASKLIKEIRNL